MNSRNRRTRLTSAPISTTKSQVDRCTCGIAPKFVRHQACLNDFRLHVCAADAQPTQAPVPFTSENTDDLVGNPTRWDSRITYRYWKQMKKTLLLLYDWYMYGTYTKTQRSHSSKWGIVLLQSKLCQHGKNVFH